MLTTIKKSIQSLGTWVLCLLPMSSCFAMVSTDQVAVGGVGPGCTTDYVESVYGPPTYSQSVSADTGEQFLEYDYEGHFLVGFNTADSQVSYVTSTGDNLKTPAGITVGMTADALTPAYGPADNTYNYNDKTLYVYDGTSGGRLAFDVQNFYIISVNVRSGQ